MKEGKKQNKQGIYLVFKKKKRLIYLVVKLQITYMGVEEDLLLEEAEEGHLEQLNRCETAYNTKNASATALFEYGWVLTRDEDVDKVNEGIKILKALQYEVKSTRGHALLTIAQAYFRLGEFNNARKHALTLIKLYPRTDPERNENLKKAIALHKKIRAEISSRGMKFMGTMWFVGVIAVFGFIAYRNRNNS